MYTWIEHSIMQMYQVFRRPAVRPIRHLAPIESMLMGGCGEAMIGYSLAQIEELNGDSNMGLCLGFEHAVKAAVSFGVGYKEYVQGLMGLEPKVFHVSDGILSEEGDEHMGIGEGEYDFRFLMGCVGEKKLVTLETPRIQKSLDKDVENFYILKESYMRY